MQGITGTRSFHFALTTTHTNKQLLPRRIFVLTTHSENLQGQHDECMPDFSNTPGNNLVRMIPKGKDKYILHQAVSTCKRS